MDGWRVMWGINLYPRDVEGILTLGGSACVMTHDHRFFLERGQGVN